MIIDSLSVHNYRCLNNIELDSFSPITVLVGRNNTGKSAFLEAAALLCTGEASWHDALGSDLIDAILRRRGGSKYAETMIRIGEKKAQIQGRSGKIQRSLLITPTPSDLSPDTVEMAFQQVRDYFDTAISDAVRALRRAGDLSQEQTNMIRAEVEGEVWEAENVLSYVQVFMQYSERGGGMPERSWFALLPEEELASAIRRRIARVLDKRSERLIGRPSFYTIERKEAPLFRTSSNAESKTVFLLSPTMEYLKELQRGLAKSGDLLSLIENLANRIPYLKDIREVDKEFLVFMKGLRKPVPLEAMGDGFRAKLTMLSAIATLKRGIVMMEEPETRLHPGFMSSVVRQMVETASEGLIQYVVSTHSMDFLEFLLGSNPEIIKVVRLYRNEKDSKIDYEILSGKEAQEELKELEMDLRGI